MSLRLTSKSSYRPAARIVKNVVEIGFSQVSEATIVSGGKFWKRKVFRNGQELVTISDEIGEVIHLKDPIVNICASEKTTARIEKIL